MDVNIELGLLTKVAHSNCFCFKLELEDSYIYKMPKAKTMASLSGMIDSGSEEASDLEMMPTPNSNQENTEPTKKAPGRPKTAATRTRKTKPASRRLSGGPKPKAAAKKKLSAKRPPLKEQANGQQATDIEEADDFVDEIPDNIDQPQTAVSAEEADELVEAKKQPAKRGRAAKKPQQATKDIAVTDIKVTENDGEFEYTPTAARQSKLASKASKRVAVGKLQAPSEVKGSEKVISETQPVPMDLEQAEPPSADAELEEDVPQSAYRQVNHARVNSKQQQPLVARRRGGSASDAERGGNDPATRRKLGEMTKKFENLELKYRNLRDVGIKEAEANFEKLKKQSEEKTKGEALIVSIPMVSTETN